MRIHTPRISGSLAVSSSVLTIDTLGSVSGSATSTGSYGTVETAGDLNVTGNGYFADSAGIYTDKIRRYTDSDNTTKILLNDEVLKFNVGHASTETLNIQKDIVLISGSLNVDAPAYGNITASGDISVGTMSIPSVTTMSSSVATRFDSRETDMTLATASITLNESNMTLATASIAAITSSISRLDTEAETNETNMTLATASIAAITASLGQPVNTDSNVTFGDITSTGTITATEIHTTFVSSSIAISSGSNIFGDDTSDSHQFTGSVDVSGSLTLGDGNLVVNDNVGIGTDNPADELEVHGATAAIKIRSTGTDAGNNPSINFQSTEATGLAARAEISADDDGATTKGALIFKTRISDSVTEAMRIDGTGKVGIGVSSPGGNLVVSSSTKTDVLVGGNSSVFSDNGRSNVEINGSGTSTLSMTIGGAAKGLLFHDGTNSYFRNYANGYYAMYTNNTERARISAAGNVLIGTTDDDARLMVKKVDGTSYGQFVTIEGDTTDNNNYPGISFKGGSLANAYPEIGASNGGLMFQLSGGYHSSNYNNRTKIQLNGSDGHILFMTGGDPAVEKAKLDANGLFKINQNNAGSAGTSNKFLSVGGELSTQFDETDVGTFSGITISNEYTNASNQSGTACGIAFTHHSASSGISYIASEAGANSGDRSDLVFGTRGSGGVEERMRLDNGGQIFFGKGGDGYIYLYEVNDNSNYFLMYVHTDTTFRLNHNGSGSDELQLQSDGDMIILGTLTESSDVRLKENIKTIPDALSKVNQMRGVSYNKIGEEKVRIGMVADEVEKIIPELVRIEPNEDVEGLENLKSLAYADTVAVLVEAIKELSSQITDLKKEIEDLKS